MKKDGLQDFKDMSKKLFKKGDLILVVVLIVAIVLTIVFATKKSSGIVEIYVDGTLKYQSDLSVSKVIELKDEGMSVVIRDGRVWVEHSDCENQLCVHSAPISRGGGMIVCAPNKVVVSIPAKGVDAIT